MLSSTSYHEIAVARARALPGRLVFGVLILAGTLGITGSLWALAWFAVHAGAQLISEQVARPLRRDPRRRPSRWRERAYLASMFLNGAAFAAVAPLLWFQGGTEGRMVALVALMGGMLNVVVESGSAKRLLLTSSIPVGATLAGLPLASVILEPDARPTAMLFLVAGVALYVAHLVLAVRRGDAVAAELRSALRDAKAERLRAEQANAAKSEFLATMSHEIRTPLNGVLGMTQAMAGGELPDVQRQRLEVVRQSGEVLLTLLNDLLDISKIEAAKLELEEGVVDLEALLGQAEAVFAPLARAKGLGFRTWIADAARGPRRGDPVRVRQVLYNLLSNALKFTAEGRITAFVSGDAGEVVIEVADTGPGIPPDRMQLLFERFTQADATMTRRFGGSGLGLSISRGLARLMGGDITVRSSAGEGSVFTVRLPLQLAPGAAVADPAPVAPEVAVPAPAGDDPAATDGLRILVAEDNATNQLVLRTLLEQVGLSAQIVENGREAVEAWRAAPWDVILMDVQMPVMDGLDATREIRDVEAAEGRAYTPIIALTANAMTHHAKEYEGVGMDALVPKPVQFDQLLAAIQKVLDGDSAGGADEAAA